MALVQPVGGRRRHEVLEIDPERVGDPIDVVEEADYVRGVENRAVVEAMAPQGAEVRLRERGGFEGHAGGEVEQGARRRVHGRRVAMPVLDGLDQRIVAGSRTEILPVSFASVVTVVEL